jgi:hypothetical protein
MMDEVGATAGWAMFNLKLACSMTREAAAITTQIAGVHATTFGARVRASRRLLAGLGGRADSDDSFPHTHGEHLPTKRMFIAALTFLSWVTTPAAHLTPYNETVQTSRTREDPTAAAGSRGVSFIEALHASAGVLAFIPQVPLEHPPACIELGLGDPRLLQASGCSPRSPPFSDPTVAIASSTGKAHFLPLYIEMRKPVRHELESHLHLAALLHFATQPPRGLRVARQVRSGICHINGPTVHDEAQMPFGGVGASGYGRFGGKADIDQFTELHWITMETQPGNYPI